MLVDLADLIRACAAGAFFFGLIRHGSASSNDFLAW